MSHTLPDLDPLQKTYGLLRLLVERRHEGGGHVPANLAQTWAQCLRFLWKPHLFATGDARLNIEPKVNVNLLQNSQASWLARTPIAT